MINLEQGREARQSASREKQLEKIELPDIQKSLRISPLFRFKQLSNSGKLVLKIDQITKDFENKQILSLSIRKGPVNYVKKGPTYLKFFMPYYLQI